MIPIKIFRKNPDKIRESERKRFRDISNVDKVIEYDEKWRENIQKLQNFRAERNKISKNFSKVAKSGDKAALEDLKSRSKSIKENIENLETHVEELKEKREEYRYKVGNILQDDVPVSEDEADNIIIRKTQNIQRFGFDPRNHVELVELIDGVELKKASTIAGSRFYYLKNDLVRLNQALINFALDILEKAGYILLQTPFFTKYEVMKEAAELADFEEQLYKIEGEDLFLIATSEQTLAALHRNEIIHINLLPLRYAGYSTCFRKEAGSHGKDTLGIFRVHQFEKVEQYIFCKEEDSAKIHEELIQNAEEIYNQLKLPYRIVSIVSGELNDNASKKYDLEGWFPASETYRELVSCTNCLNYQANKLKIRYGILGDNTTTKKAHTLNSTAIATERTICCILENYQKADGTVIIPEVLQPYMGGREIIPSQK